MEGLKDGQWIGRVEGDAPGIGVLELDDYGDHLSGHAYHFPDDKALPSVAATINTKSRDLVQILENVPLVAVNPDIGVWLPPGALKEHFPNTNLASHASLSLDFSSGDVNFSYKTEITNGKGYLRRSSANTASTLAVSDTVLSWRDFRDAAFSEEPNRFLYRGQSVQNRLRTSFHRTKRKDLALFRDKDITDLRRVLSPTLKNLLNANDSNHNGALYNLAQHHGYPTPLLDWSASPFVAAYFAFQARPGDRALTEKVRLFAFDQREWRRDMPQLAGVAYSKPHFSIIELLPIENMRMIPQQATATITNIDDIEDYIEWAESQNKKQYLTVIDLPLSDRQAALSDLDLMGINAGSLFPGIDGACEALRYKNFGPA